MYKLFVIAVLSFSVLLLVRCRSTTLQNVQKIVLSQPSFANSAAYFKTYNADVQGGDSGIDFYLDLARLPEDIVLEKVYFRKSSGQLKRGTGYYVARLPAEIGKERDVVMSSDPNEEAVNTPPAVEKQFPWKLGKNEAGITYRKNGVRKYVKIIHVKEQKHISSQSDEKP